MSITDKKIKHREKVRASIIDASLEIVREEGWPALSVRKIADEIGFSAPVIYDYFQNKEALLLQLTRQGFSLLNEKLLQAKGLFSEPSEQLKSMADAYWTFAHNNSIYYQLMYGLGIPSCEMVNTIDELKEFSTIMSDTIGKLLQANDRSDETLTKFKGFWSLLHGLVSIERIKNVNESGEDKDVLNDFVNTFLANCKSRS